MHSGSFYIRRVHSHEHLNDKKTFDKVDEQEMQVLDPLLVASNDSCVVGAGHDRERTVADVSSEMTRTRTAVKSSNSSATVNSNLLVAAAGPQSQHLDNHCCCNLQR